MSKVTPLMFILTLLVGMNTARADVVTCGTAGEISERIAHCSEVFMELATKKVRLDDPEDPFDDNDHPTYHEWKLVTRTATKHQVWRDESTGLIWSDMRSDVLEKGEASELCERDSYLTKLKGYLNLAFHLPTLEQVQAANLHALHKVNRDVEGVFFWTQYGVIGQYMFKFTEQGGEKRYGSTATGIICVARP